MRRLTLTIIVTAAMILLGRSAWSSPASSGAAGQPGPPTTTLSNGPGSGTATAFGAFMSGGDEPEVTVSYTELQAAGEGAPGRVATAVRQRVCELWVAPGGPGSMGTENRPLEAVAGPLVDGEWYYQTCRFADTGELASSRYWPFRAGQGGGFGLDLAALAATASDRIPLPFPVPGTAPTLEQGPLTGLDTWLWIDPVAWQTREATAELSGFSVTVTATPRAVVWDMGEGERPENCDGPGTAWRPEIDHRGTDCAYNYRWNSTDEPDGVFHASVKVVWSIAWRASTGETGVLADGSRTTTFDVDVHSLEAQICYGNVCPEGEQPVT